MSTDNSAPSESQDFDFWIGTWTIRHRVLQNDGSWRDFDARTTVVPDLDGVILVEHWEGVCLLPWEGMVEPEVRKALSVRAYDPVDKQWHIHWIDTRGRKFIPVFSGGFTDGRGEFFADLPGGVRSRIVFRDITNESVVWENAVEDAGEWKAIWVMEMYREPGADTG
ncbi:MAG: hypothetical protein AAF327_21060 [Cyanobacteria bacterium P01_A01_bin.37]